MLCCAVLNRSVMSNSATPWTVARQASLSLGFPSKEYRNGLLVPSPGDLSNPGIQSKPPAWQADSLPLSHQGSPLPILVHILSNHSKT